MLDSRAPASRLTIVPVEEKDAFEIQFYENVIKRNPSDSAALELLGSLYSKYGESKKTLRIDRRLVKIAPEDPRNHYNLACSLSVLGRKAEALKHLDIAIQTGYQDFDWLQKDSDLENLKDDPRFQKILDHFKAKLTISPSSK